MIKLDDNLLAELGLASLPAEEKKKMLAHVYETLEMRVGMELAKQMSDAQLNEFEQFINRNDEAGALRWLETNFPNYKDVVAAEFEKLKGEIRQLAPQILANAEINAGGQAAGQVADPMGSAAMPQQPMPQQPYQPQPQQQPYQPYPTQPMPQYDGGQPQPMPSQPQPQYPQPQQPNPYQQPYPTQPQYPQQPPQQQPPYQQY